MSNVLHMGQTDRLNFGRTYKIIYWGQSQIPLRPDNQMSLLGKLPHFQQHMCAYLYTFIYGSTFKGWTLHV